MTSWQLSLGRDDLKYTSAKEITGLFVYEKGKGLMKTVPKEADMVWISYRAQHILTAIVLKSFEPDQDKQSALRDRHSKRVWMQIVDHPQPTYLRGQRRNWTILKNE